MAAREIFSVIGARPHFMKAAPIMEVMQESSVNIFTIHTGQHYDVSMSDVFFRELSLPSPDVNLGIGSGTHGIQTAEVLRGVEALILERKPESVMVFGDTNSTLGAALAAAKLYVPVVHIEAGVRCANLRMPEEINRRLIDRVSSYMACPSSLAVANLQAEGIVEGVSNVGDTMYDAFLAARRRLSLDQQDRACCLRDRRDLDMALMTLHREETTRSPERLMAILSAVNEMGRNIVFPMHPRTRKVLESAGFRASCFENIRAREPMGYLETVKALDDSAFVLTDSGGLQKEAYWSGVPCVTLMSETTWMETVDEGWNKLVGLDVELIKSAVESALDEHAVRSLERQAYGTAGAARRVASQMEWI